MNRKFFERCFGIPDNGPDLDVRCSCGVELEFDEYLGSRFLTITIEPHVCQEVNKMTIDERNESHYKMWNWLSKNTDKCKRDYFSENNVETPGESDCFLCEYECPGYTHSPCDACPLNMADRLECDDGSRYNQWRYAKGGERAELARQIRDVVPEPKERKK